MSCDAVDSPGIIWERPNYNGLTFSWYFLMWLCVACFEVISLFLVIDGNWRQVCAHFIGTNKKNCCAASIAIVRTYVRSGCLKTIRHYYTSHYEGPTLFRSASYRS